MATQMVEFPFEETERRVKHVLAMMPALARTLMAAQETLSIRNSSSAATDRTLMQKAEGTIESTIVRSLSAAFPDDRIISEDEGESGNEGDFQWWCDPVDGTRNFIHGIPFFCTSLGLCHRGTPVAGVVHMPLLGQTGLTYHAISGAGAFRNMTPIRVSTVDTLDRAVMASGLPYQRKEILSDLVSDIFSFVSVGIGLRRTGSTITDLCFIADGKFDALWDRAQKPWDTCAASVIVREAGGRITGFQGELFDIYQTQIVASNGMLHEEVIGVLQKSRKTGMN